jgi:hypothetical protein
MRLLFLSFAVTELSDDDRGSADNGRKPLPVRETISGVDDVEARDIAPAKQCFQERFGLFISWSDMSRKGPGTGRFRHLGLGVGVCVESHLVSLDMVVSAHQELGSDAGYCIYIDVARRRCNTDFPPKLVPCLLNCSVLASYCPLLPQSRV